MFSSGLSESARKRAELALAVAQEKLLSDHVDHALDLVALVDEDVSFTDALEIYTRIMRLDEDAAQNVSTRALAVLGERVGPSGTLPSRAVRSAPGAGPGDRSWFGQLKDRVRGRVNEDLRRRIELIAARAEVSLLHTHVENALEFVDFLGEEDGIKDQKAVEIYLDALDVRDSIAEVTYYLALARIADDVLPEHGSGRASAGEATEREPLGTTGGGEGG
ncbi:MAG: hypothetical protein P8177_09425 [Gemmatimonadota bacterium]